MTRHRVTAALAGLVLTVASPAMAAGLSPQEQKLVAASVAEEARSLALLEKLVNMNSGTLNVAGVTKVGALLQDEFRTLGFDVKWVPMTSVDRAGHIVATHKGSGRGKRMLLIGHFDTVFEPDSPFRTYVRRGDVAEGPGVNDMKGGLVIMIAALRAMQAAGTLKDADITVVLTGDEERAGLPISVSRADLVAAAKTSDMALEFESLARENGKDMASIARRSSTDWTIKVTAESGHSSGVFSDGAGYGAAYELARILDGFRREAREVNATFNVGYMAAGASAAENASETGASALGKNNIIAGQAVAKGDLRTLSNAQTDSIHAKMKAIVGQPLTGATAEIAFGEGGYPAMAPTEGSRKLLARLNEVNRDLGLEPMAELDPLKRGAGDIGFVGDLLPGLIGFGAAGDGAHAAGETMDLKSLDRQTKRAALFMSRMAKP
ncbi:M20/M25/M40 family metallo-hydrolase [Phenylobacterium sp.]|uniref:M20/M25/M40 family metallo-hydrolase n=1 Tax=Phenylobacterium sp. TaxID=1871053 RepID=UPI00286CE990|nr:M20/M25/M40 family metallo-hydrolase [Phenylobacterium sp.]